VTHELKNGRNTVCTKPAKLLNTRNAKIGVRSSEVQNSGVWLTPPYAFSTVRESYQNSGVQKEEGKTFYPVSNLQFPILSSKFI
jgi:hypothetical protein